MLPDSFLMELKYRVDIEQLIGGYVQLRRRGKNLTGLCPFHSEKTPSFTVYPESQSFYCFGCGAGGDAISFIRRMDNLDYLEAVRVLAERVGLPMPEGAAEDRTHQIKLRLLEMNREAARHWHRNLMSEAGKPAREYLVSRGLTRETAVHFGLGYAPESWDDTCGYLRGLGYTEEEIVLGSLGVRRTKGGSYDAFRNRVIFPIIDLRGAVIAFGGRNLGDKGPKYLNSGDTPVFKKSRNLFALNFAKNAGRGELILAEGYMDVVSMHQAGFTGAVATLGTALTDEQARLLVQYTDEVVLSYDSDEPGQIATRRAAGLLEKAGARVRILSIPDAKDPDEYIKKFGAERFELLLQKSAGATDYQIDRLRAKYDLSRDADRVAFLQDFVRLMAQIENPIRREVYMGRICRELEVDPQAVEAQLVHEMKKRRAAKDKKEASQLRAFLTEAPGADKDPMRQRNPREVRAGEGVISYLLQNPDGYSWVAGQLSPEDFLLEGDGEIYAAICEKLREGKTPDMTLLGAVLPEKRLARLVEIMARDSYQGTDKRQAADCIQCLLAYRNKKTKDELGKMGDEDYGRYISSMIAHKK